LGPGPGRGVDGGVGRRLTGDGAGGGGRRGRKTREGRWWEAAVVGAGGRAAGAD
jgi:hypothetical protein